MQQYHHTLRRDLTKTMLLWSGSFFALLVVVFLLSFHRLEGYLLDLMAGHRLTYQSAEFAKHLADRDRRSIGVESDALVQDRMIRAIVMIDASGALMHVSIHGDEPAQLKLHAQDNFASFEAEVATNSHLHLYRRDIPGQRATLVLVLDDRPVEVAILSATIWGAVLMLLLLLVSIRALHVTLRKQLIRPVEQVREIVEEHAADAQAVYDIEQSLPEEAAEILDAFGDIQHASDEVRSHLIELMRALPACFWWSNDGITYAGVSDKCVAVLGRASDEVVDSRLWSWSGDVACFSGNAGRLQEAIAAHEEQLDFAYKVKRGDREQWYGESLTLCYDREGSLESVYGIITDISARKERQLQQAKQLEAVRRMETTATLVGGIAHEFNNALAGMNGNLFLLRQSAADAESRNRIGRIEQLIERSAEMIDNMLAFARKSMVKSEPLNLVEFLKQFERLALPALSNRTQFKLNLDARLRAGDEGEVIISADPRKLQDALMQLLENAGLAVSEVALPSITMDVSLIEADETLLRRFPELATSHLVHLKLQDNGCGIPDEILPRIFEPFFTTREVGQGTGLGLSMVHGYLHQLGGTVDVESETGAGATFHLYIPWLKAITPVREAGGLIRGNGEKVLVVDDDRVFRESTAEVLIKMGYQPITAADGKQAVVLFGDHQREIELIFMDILMPGINGIETSRRIRKMAPEIPIIFLTGYDRTQPLEPEVYEEHAMLINKPFRITTLSRAIRQALSAERERNEKRS